ncbi:MAG: endonuclease/exonuclease/phosphatase family protein [Candidatus Sumerlaeia bacterium]
MSRSEWLSRWLKLPRSEGSPTRPGLVLIQIDGLSRYQLLRAIRKRRMPFLHHLMRREGYDLQRVFSGVPSNTPSVQGELFYGVRQAAPGFSYYDRTHGNLVRMYDNGAAAAIEERLAAQGQALLAEGTAYGDVYTGGAEQALFCFARLGLNDYLAGAKPLALPAMFVANFFAIVRLLANVAIEFVLAIIDFIRGIAAGQSIGHEFRFIPFRVGITSLMRDLITMCAKIDITRGVPVIHLNFLGYDEQAHRRGPDSAFAHWTLKGIDTAIRHIWHAARNASRRDYDVWVYSDHGQEGTIPFPVETGRTIEEAVAEVFGNFDLFDREDRQRNRRGIQNRRIALFGGRLSRRGDEEWEEASRRSLADGVRVTAMGPLGHIYLPEPLDDPDEQDRAAVALVRVGKIPIVMATDGSGHARAWNESGRWRLPEQAAEVLGENHPYLAEAARDLVSLCNHPNAGDFVISGWRVHRRPMSFPIENGAHAGPGSRETDAFAIVPGDAPIPDRKKAYLRPADLRQMVLNRLGRAQMKPRPPATRTRPAGTLRVMTYNIHSCIGMDGKIAPERAARIIGQFQPDVVALQEVDVGRQRTGFIDQAEMIAHLLEMNFAFHPALTIEEEQYGIAVLSRYPMRLIKAGPLPGLRGRPLLEPRGALWIGFEHDGRPMQLINTHLGLRHRERLAQIEALLGREWLGSVDSTEGPLILCGDLNAVPSSIVCRRIGRRLLDAQHVMENHRPRATWFGRIPIGRIDHIFIEPRLSVCKIKVVNTRTARLNSDHLPLIVDVRPASM